MYILWHHVEKQSIKTLQTDLYGDPAVRNIRSGLFLRLDWKR